MIAPAPRKPIPVTICAAMRVGSVRTSRALLPFSTSRKPYAETIVKRAEPIETSMCVRSPASRSRSSRSTPITPPSTAARPILRRSSQYGSSGSVLAARSIGCLALVEGDLLDATRGQLEQRVELGARERLPLGGRLHLDEAPVAGHRDVHVDLGGRVLGVVEVEQRPPRGR